MKYHINNQNLFSILLLFLLISCDKTLDYIDSYVIKKDGLYGLIDSNGNEIIPPTYQYIEPIQKDGVALVVLDTIYTNRTDTTFLGVRNVSILNIKYGYVNKENKFIFKRPSFAKIEIGDYTDSNKEYNNFCENFSFYGGMAVAQDTTSLLYGYIGLNGDTIISAQYKDAQIFNNGRAAVQMDFLSGQKGSGKWGLINPENKRISDFVFSYIETPFNERAIATIVTINKTSAGFIEGELTKDKNGNVIVDKTKARTIEESNSPEISTKIFLVNQDGKIINEDLNMMYSYSNFSKDGISVAIPNNMANFFGLGYGFITKDGEFLKPINTDELTDAQAEKLIESKYFLNEIFPQNIEFDDATRFTDGYAAVKLGKVWVFVDKELTPRGNGEYPVFEDALPFAYGLAGIKLNGKYGYIDNNFNIIIPCKYDSCAIAGKQLCRVYGGERTENGYSIVSYIDRNNNLVWQNVDYVNDYFSIKKNITDGVWQDDIEYNYLGKDYTIIWVIVGIFVLLFIGILIYKINPINKKTRLINEPIEKELSPNNSSLSEPLVTNNKSINPIKAESQINNDKLSKPSIDKRLNDILNF